MGYGESINKKERFYLQGYMKGAGEMAQWIKEPAAKPDDLSSVPRENQHAQVVP